MTPFLIPKIFKSPSFKYFLAIKIFKDIIEKAPLFAVLSVGTSYPPNYYFPKHQKLLKFARHIRSCVELSPLYFSVWELSGKSVKNIVFDLPGKTFWHICLLWKFRNKFVRNKFLRIEEGRFSIVPV